MQAVIEDAEKKQHRDKAVGLWLAKLKDAAYDVDDILNEFQWEARRQEADDSMKSKVRTFFSSQIPILFRIRMGRRIKEIVEKLDLLAAERSKFDLRRSSGSASNYRLEAITRQRPIHLLLNQKLLEQETIKITLQRYCVGGRVKRGDRGDSAKIGSRME